MIQKVLEIIDNRRNHLLMVLYVQKERAENINLIDVATGPELKGAWGGREGQTSALKLSDIKLVPPQKIIFSTFFRSLNYLNSLEVIS